MRMEARQLRIMLRQDPLGCIAYVIIKYMQMLSRQVILVSAEVLCLGLGTEAAVAMGNDLRMTDKCA